MATEDTALTRVSKTPRLVLARSLDQASSGMFMHVDRHGHVRSPTRFRAMQALGYVSVGAAMSLPVLYGMLLGPVGAIMGGVASGFVALRFRSALRLKRAVVLVAHGRLDEATALLQAVIRARLVSRENRVFAYYNLASCAALQGDHATALAHARKARELAGARWRAGLHGSLIAYLEIAFLIELDRAAEARAALDAVGEVPAGEFLRVAHWTAELYVHMAEGRSSLDDEALHERARKGLAMTTGSRLLALTAWAFAQRDQHDMAVHALTEAFDRMENDRLERMMPRLYQWMCAYRDEHPPEAEPDPYDM